MLVLALCLVVFRNRTAAGRGDAGQVQSRHGDELWREGSRVLPDALPIHDDRHDHELLRGDPQRLPGGRRQQQGHAEPRFRSDGPFCRYGYAADRQQER